MKALKVVMGQDNYFSIADTHVFFNFNKGNLMYLNSLLKGSIKKIHVFITNHDSINHHLNEMFDKFTNPANQKPCKIKICVHFYDLLTDLIKLFKEFSGKFLDKVQLIISNRPTIFTDSKTHRYKATIRTTGKCLKVKFQFIGDSHVSLKFPEYIYYDEGSMTIENQGIFSDIKKRLNPEQFKDELIEAFKKQAPTGILKTFKSDEDIWGFIMDNAQYKMREE